jgi:hypothetical protein
MKSARRVSAVLIAIICMGAIGYRYLRYEQRNELAHYQSGFRQGVEVGQLQQREEFAKNFSCYRLSDPSYPLPDPGNGAGVVICGVLAPTDQNGNPVIPSAADPSDLEQ